MDVKRIRYLLRFVPDKLYLELCYYYKIHRRLNLKNPQTFNEKLQWLKLYNRKPEYTTMVDKYRVREYIKAKIGEEYLIPLLGGPWQNSDKIDFDALPEKFVLKCNHDSGSVVICKDKGAFDIAATKKKLDYCVKHNFWYLGREWPYKDVKPCIIAEKYMADELGNHMLTGTEEDFQRSAVELKDYKFMVFHGKVECCFVCTDRFSQEGVKCTFYDRAWNRMPFERHYKTSDVEIEKPKNYEKMIVLAEKLSEDIPFIRVDFYEVKDRIYFGELTFFPGSGFEEFRPDEWDKKLGKWIKLTGEKDS